MSDSPGSKSGPAGKPSDETESPDRNAETGIAENQMVGEFRIIRRLGQGGMARVYLAEQTTLERNVALKVLRPERVHNEINLKRFQTEAMAIGSLSHPNIVSVFTVGQHAGASYIVQEYVAGGNLKELMARKGPPDYPFAMRILRQTASALEAAHAAGIVHRDITPQNILLTPKGDVKVADFGLAQLTLDGERVNITQDGMTMGTPLYMSPEQVNGSKIDLRSDIYSLGITYYHLLAGKPPFTGKTSVAVAMAHVGQKPTPLAELREDLPPVFCKIIHKMMARDPAKRYQSATELLRDLKRLASMNEAKSDGIESTVLEHDGRDGEPEVKGSFLRRLTARIWQGPDRSWGRYFGRVLATTVLVAGGTAGAGWLLRTPNPFETEPARKSVVPNLGSADKQYFHAMMIGDSIPAWEAVVGFHDKPLYRNYAMKQLATLHFSRGQFAEAKSYFEQLADLPASEPKFRVFGRAGLAVLLRHIRNDSRASQDEISQLAGQFDLLDPWMKEQIVDTIQRNREILKEELNVKLRSILEPKPSENEQ